MFEKIEDFFLNQFKGKVIARAAVTIAAYLASGKLGAAVNVNPEELAALAIIGAHAVFEWFKKILAEKAAKKAAAK